MCTGINSAWCYHGSLRSCPPSSLTSLPAQQPECTLHQLARYSRDRMLKGCKQNPVSKSNIQVSQQKQATGAHLNLTRERFGTSVWLPLWHFNSFLCCCGNDMAKGANISFVTPPAAQKCTHCCPQLSKLNRPLIVLSTQHNNANKRPTDVSFSAAYRNEVFAINMNYLLLPCPPLVLSTSPTVAVVFCYLGLVLNH